MQQTQHLQGAQRQGANDHIGRRRAIGAERAARPGGVAMAFRQQGIPAGNALVKFGQKTGEVKQLEVKVPQGQFRVGIVVEEVKGLDRQVKQGRVGRGQGAEGIQQFGNIKPAGGAVVAGFDGGESVDDLGFGYQVGGVRGSAAGQGEFQQRQGFKVSHQLAGQAAGGAGAHGQFAVFAGVDGGNQIRFAHRGFAEGQPQGAVSAGQRHLADKARWRRRQSDRSFQGAAAGQGAAEGGFVGKFQRAAHGKAQGKAGNADAPPGQAAVDKVGGGIALQRGVGGND